AAAYTRLLVLYVQKKGKALMMMVLGQKMDLQVGGAKITYYLERFEQNGDSFPQWTYEAYPEPQVLAVKAVELARDYEKDILGGVEASEYEDAKKEAIEYLQKMHPQSSIFD